MADGDDQERPGSPPEEGALESWGDLGDGGRGRVSRSWSQIAALDEQGRPARSTEEERPVEGLLTVDSGLLDIMAREEAADRTPADGLDDGGVLPDDFDLDTPIGDPSALPDDFDLDDGAGPVSGALPDMPLDDILREDAPLDGDPFGGALPDDIDFEALDDEGALPALDDLDELAENGALPDDADFGDFDDGDFDSALPDDVDFGDFDDGALPDDADFADDTAIGRDAPVLPDDFDLDAPIGDADAAFDLGDPDALDGLDDLDDLDGALPDDFDFDEPIGTDGALPDDLASVEASLETVPGEDDFDPLDELDDLDAIGAALAGDGAPALEADALAIDDDLDLDESLDDFGLDPDLAIGGEGDDWLDDVLDQVEGPGAADEGWGDLLDDDGPAEPMAEVSTLAELSDPPAPIAPDADLWALAAEQWDDEPEPPSKPASMPFDDPFAAPVRGGLEDETRALGDPFSRLQQDRGGRRMTGELPAVEARAPSPEAAYLALDGALPRDDGPPASQEVASESPTLTEAPSGPVAPSAAQVQAALELLIRRSAERRGERIADADDPEVMMVEEVLEDGPERRVVRVEYPRLGELEILELPEDGEALPGLDDDFDAFADGYVFFEEDALDAPPDRRSALAALSREPVELARLLEPVDPVEDSTDIALDRAFAEATVDVDPAPAPLPLAPAAGEALFGEALFGEALFGEHDGALAHDDAVVGDDDTPALAIEPTPSMLPLDGPDDADDGLGGLRPGWQGADLGGALDPALVEQLGAPFIGIIPPFGARNAVGSFPPGSLAIERAAPPDGPAVVPRLTLRLPAEQTWAHRLACFLIDEASSEPERGRLAALMHGLGVIAHRPLGDEAVALEALRAALENDPDVALSRWALQALLDEAGLHDELLDRLVHAGSGDDPREADGDTRHRAGHLARTALGDDEQALWQWARASNARPHAASRLARYLLLTATGAPDARLEALDDLLEAAEGPVWWSALALDRVRSAARAEAFDLQQAELLLEEAIRRRGGVPAVFAAIERHALARGRMSLWLSALRARFDRVMADYEGGALSETLAQHELAEIFVKAGLALDQLGRRTEALGEYHHALRSLPDDPYALHRAAELARRLGDHGALRQHLDRLAQLSHTAEERADAAYQMGLVAQQILGDDNAAEQDFGRALAALPTMSAALAALGRLDLRRGRLDAIQDRYADEIRELEAALRQPQAAAERRRTVTTLVDRYYRLARLLEETGDAPVALDVYKRALAVDPRFLPAFEAMDRLYVRHGRWRERTALILGWVQRQKGAPLEAIGPLLSAADALRVHLDDPENAARVAARTLALAPSHPYALRRASETFALLGNTAARIEVDLRWGRLDGDARRDLDGLRATKLLRAAQLQELDGDPLAAAAEALPIYREALARDPEALGAIDGLMRTALRLGRTGELVQQMEAHDLAAHPSPVLALPMAEALLAAGRPDEAAEFLIRWRARARAAGTMDRAADAGSLALLALACERTDHWRMLADTLEEQATLTEGRARAVLLARSGALWELRLEAPALAADAYRRAVEADPECAAARAGALRLAAMERGDWRPAGAVAEALGQARAADLEQDADARTAALDRVAAAVDDPRTAVAWRALARGETTSLEAAGALYAAHPERGDLFATYRRRLEEAGDLPGLVEALWTRLDYEDEPGRTALLTAIIGHGLRIDDRPSVHEAVEALLAMDPTSLPALLAQRRLARAADDPAASTEVSRTLTGVLRAPGPAAAAHHAVAIEAEARGEAPAQVQRLLTQAVEINPADDDAARALGERLRAAGEWSKLAELHQRRLAAIADPARRRPVARELARLLADRFEDLPGAWRVLRRELSAEAADPETALLAAQIAGRAGQSADADACFALAARADGGRMRLDAMRGQARAWQTRGESEKARVLAERVLKAAPDDAETLELLAELLAAAQKWKGVVQIFRRLMKLEPDPSARAERALAIGEIFARVYGDPRRAAGWFKRAIELDPSQLRAVWRLLEEAGNAPPDAVPIEHVEDALDRAVEARRRAIAERPDPEALGDLARLHARRGDRDGQLLVGEALCWLGLADERTRRWVEAAHKRVSVDFARPLGDELRRTLLEDAGERGRARMIFDAFALVLTEVLAGAMPAGVARLSRRSFPEWQAEFRRLAAGLGVDDVELHNGGRSVVRFRGLYLPRPAIAVPQAALAGPLESRQAFAVGQLLDGLREGRLLLEAPGVERVESCAGVMAATLCPGLIEPPAADAVPAELRDRLAERARRLPRRIKLQLDGLAARSEGPVDFARLARAVASTRARAGLLCCGDLQIALDAVVFPDAAAAEAARRSGGVLAALDSAPAGRALLTYALGADHARLRRVLALGLSGRAG